MKFNNSRILSIAGLIIALSVAYYLVVFIPNKEKTKQELEKEKFNAELQFKTQQMEDKENNLEECLRTSFENYRSNWDLNCPKYALNSKDKGCSLPKYISGALDQDYEKDQELCIKKYK